MRKIVLGFAAAALVLSCKKVPKGSNYGVIPLEDGVERYDSHETRGGGAHGTDSAGVHSNAARTAVEVDVNGTKMKAYQGGLEQTMVGFLSSDVVESSA